MSEGLTGVDRSLPGCPFCGSAAEVCHDSQDQWWSVDCSENSCAVKFGETRAEAVTFWSRRPQERELLDVLVDLFDSDPCSHDHKGDCQTHCWFDVLECPHARAERLLAAAGYLDGGAVIAHASCPSAGAREAACDRRESPIVAKKPVPQSVEEKKNETEETNEAAAEKDNAE